MSATDAAGLHSSDESARLKIGRRLGWGAVPSNDFVAKKIGDQVLLQGSGHGHGIGLCQAGARAMAEAGASVQEILNHLLSQLRNNPMERQFPSPAGRRQVNPNIPLIRFTSKQIHASSTN
ncbi:MAG: hypothetical protein WAM79_04210 [Candidatus Sulfotelmatobacter sp.]